MDDHSKRPSLCTVFDIREPYDEILTLQWRTVVRLSKLQQTIKLCEKKVLCSTNQNPAN